MVRLRDIMTKDVISAFPDMTIREAMEILSQRHLGGAPVLDGGKVVGIFSASDLLSLLVDVNDTTASLSFRGRRKQTTPLEDITVDEVMTRKVHCLGPDSAIEEAAALMVEKQIHRILVMEEGSLLGIVSTSDLAKAVAEHRTGHRTYVFA